MLEGSLRMLARTFAQHRFYTAINIAGLALGIAVFLTMGLIVRYEYGYDADLPDTASVYRVDTVYRMPGSAANEWAVSSFFPVPFLERDFPGITATLRVWTRDVAVRTGRDIERETLTQADADFFAFFRLTAIEGSAAQAFAEPGGIAIPASLARKYFGTTQAVGRSLTLPDDGGVHPVSFVYADPPPNTSVHFGIVEMAPPSVLHHATRWNTTPGTLWVRIPDARALPAIEAGMARYVTRHPSVATVAQARAIWGDSGLHLVPYRAIHFHDWTIGVGGANRRLVIVLGLIGVAALATAAINYINLATARAGLRAREVAMRKVVGATRLALIGQFLGEAVVMVAIASLIGTSLAEIGLHWIATLGGWRLAMDPVFVGPMLVGITVGIGCLAGFYPALVLSSFRPAAVLAMSRTPSGGRWASRLRAILAVSQFSFAIVLAICTLVMNAQARFVEHAARGIRTDCVIVIGWQGTMGRERSYSTDCAPCRVLPWSNDRASFRIMPAAGWSLRDPNAGPCA